MSAGKIAAGAIVVSSVVAGALMYYLQVYAYYDEVSAEPGKEVVLTPIASQTPEPIVAEGFAGIDSESSPLRYRACFTTPLSLAMLTETYQMFDNPEPLIGPGWFDCYKAEEIGAALESGEALAFLSEPLGHYGMDRVVAIYGDGRGFVWNQINECGKAFYDGRDLPAGCPVPPTGAAPADAPAVPEASEGSN